MSEGLYRIFDSIWWLSLVGGYCILMVILARFLLKKAPKWCSYLLWGIVFVRLCCPVLPETGISLIPERLLAVGTQTRPAQVADMQLTDGRDNSDLAGDVAGSMDAAAGQNGSGGNVVGGGTVDTVGTTVGVPNSGYNYNAEHLQHDNVNASVGMTGNSAGSVDVVDGQNPDSTVDTGISSRPLWLRGLALLWLLGMAGFLVFHVFSYLRMRHRIRRPDSSVRQVEPGICEIDGGHLSFVMGLVHPVIYLSSGLDSESRKVVLCHERVHLQRRDYLWKPAALVICCVHWFNPLVWLAFYLMNMDCEMSCDEKVVKLLGEESKKIYSYTLLEEASGGEWKRYRGGSICALLSFGEDHVKNRIRHVLDYRKPPFWMLVGAAAVIMILVVCLCSNPGSRGDVQDAVNADNGAETGADATEEADRIDATDEAAGDLAADDADYETAKEEWLSVFEQGIHNREEFSVLFDVTALDETHSFAGQDGIQYLGYNGVAARKLHRQILDGDTVAHETYKDPVKAAEALLNLQGGRGIYTQVHYEGRPQYEFYREDPDRFSEGTVLNIEYTFSDGSIVNIPMVMAEESSQIWLLSVGDKNSNVRHSYGPLDGETQARVVYAEYIPVNLSLNSTVEMLTQRTEYTRVDPGSLVDVEPIYQISSYGIYATTDDGLECVVPGYIAPGYVAQGWSAVSTEYRYFYTSNQHMAETAHPDNGQGNVLLYYLASSNYQEGDPEIWIDTIREYDTSEQTGEGGITDWKLPAEAQDFYKAVFRVEDGYWVFDNSDRSKQLKIPLLSARPVWNGKMAADLTAEEMDAYAAAQRQDILTNVGIVYDLSERAEQETYALLDLDGDGSAERIILRSRMAQATNEPDHSPLDKYVFAVNTTRGETRTAQNLGNSIYAFSPDGRQILLALMRRDEWGKYESILFRYVKGELQEIGSFAHDIRDIWVEDGEIITSQSYDYTLQRENLRIVYRIGNDGQLQQVPVDRYVLPDFNTLHSLTRDIEVYRDPEVSSERFTVSTDHGVYLRYLDGSRQWLCVETDDGAKGWLRLADYTAEEAWATFNDLMPYGG